MTTDPYRSPEAPLARVPGTPPLWESFVTWGMALISILFSLLVWANVIYVAVYGAGTGGSMVYMNARAWTMIFLLSLPFVAGSTLLMSKSVSVVVYAAFTVGMLMAFLVYGRGQVFLVMDACGLVMTLWVMFVWRRGRFRRG